MSDDVLSEFDALIIEAEADEQAGSSGEDGPAPWLRHDPTHIVYQPNMQLLTKLLTGPLRAGYKTQSGRLAKAFDAWMAYELRRAGFQPSEVWPRNKAPRVSSPEMDALTEKVAGLRDWVTARDLAADEAAQAKEAAGDEAAVEAARARLAKVHKRLTSAHDRRQVAYDKRVQKATAKGTTPPDPPPSLDLPDRATVQDELPAGLRQAIQAVEKAMPWVNATNVLGRFYVKQVDVVVSASDRGPDVLISGKTMFSSFAKNTKNRYEETLGEASNLRDRYPLAGMGYAFLVSNDIFEESGAFGRLQDLLLRTRKPFGPYDATMLLIASWSPATGELTIHDPSTYPDPSVSGQQPPVDLSASKFFTDLLGTVITNTPVGIHQPVRDRRNGSPVPGGTPTAEVVPSESADDADEADDAGTAAT